MLGLTDTNTKLAKVDEDRPPSNEHNCHSDVNCMT